MPRKAALKAARRRFWLLREVGQSSTHGDSTLDGVLIDVPTKRPETEEQSFLETMATPI